MPRKAVFKCNLRRRPIYTFMKTDDLAQIQEKILVIREKKIMLDSDLASLYEVEVKRLIEAVKRNNSRFPDDFMFRLTKPELKEVVAICDHLSKLKFRSTLPYAFTEQGVAMLSSVLNSQKAIEVNIQIMRAFIQLRNLISSNDSLYDNINDLRKLLLLYIEKNDKRVNDIIIALNNLIEQPQKQKIIGFQLPNPVSSPRVR